MEHVNSSQINSIFLDTGVANLGYGPITIQMSEGTGWIAHDGRDITIEAGDCITLEKDAHPILISSPLRHQPIRFTVEQPKIQHQLKSSRRQWNPLPV